MSNYPSRFDKKDFKGLIKRKIPTVNISIKSVTGYVKKQLSDYNKKGFLVINDFLSKKQKKKLKDDCVFMKDNPKSDENWVPINEYENSKLRSIYSVHKSNNCLSKISNLISEHPILNFILGREHYIHQSRVNYKQPFFGEEFYWHSDFETWHIEDGMPEMNCVTTMIPVDNNTAVNSPIMVIPGSHKLFFPTFITTPETHWLKSLKGSRVGSPDTTLIEEIAYNNGVELITCKPGSLVLMDCNLLHASNRNLSPFERTNLFLVFNSVRNRLKNPKNGLKKRPNYLAERNPEKTKF